VPVVSFSPAPIDNAVATERHLPPSPNLIQGGEGGGGIVGRGVGVPPADDCGTSSHLISPAGWSAPGPWQA
jgi:hypothetical protein